MSIWRISGSLMLSQNFVKNWKFSWPRSLAKFWDFDQLFKTFISDLWMNCKSQNGNLEWSLCSIWMISGSLRLSQNFVKNWKFSWPQSLAKFWDFDQVFKTFISALLVDCNSHNGILEYSLVHLKDFWKFEVESKFCEKLKIFMTAVLSEISDFDQLFKIFISDLWMNCKSQNGILECSYVDLKDFWKSDVKSKYCEKLKIFMTVVLSEISDFYQLFKTVISNLRMNCKSQNGNLECSLCSIWRISGSLRLSQNFVKNWKFSWPRSLAKFQILTKFSRLSFQTCKWIASLKMAF